MRTVVKQGGIIQSASEIGNHCIVNTGSSVGHDCQLSDYVHIAPHAPLVGNVLVGAGTWIGAGVRQGITIGAGIMIGIGTVVVKDIPDNVTAYGNPCKIIKHMNIEKEGFLPKVMGGGIKRQSEKMLQVGVTIKNAA